MNARSIAAQASDDMSLQVPDPLLASALFQALLWKPRFMMDSPVTVHVPLLYWLSCVLRPQSVTVVGAGDGMAHFAFCQALDHLGSSGRCEAFGFWRDTNTREVVARAPARLREHQEMLYDGLSKIMPCATLDEALDQMKPADIDLLFCDLSALPKDTQFSVETLLACLSNPGILLLHGTKKAKQSQVNIRGMIRFVDDRRYVDFSEGEGLTLICSGKDLPAPLQLLVDMASGGLLRRDVEQVFRRSGQGLRAIAEGTVRTRARQLAEKTVINTQEMLQKLQEELKSLQESHDSRSANLAKTQCEVFALRRELEELASTVVVRTTERDAAKVDAEAARQAQAETSALLAAIHEEAAAARNGLESERKIRFEETEALTQISEELRNKLDTTEAALVERTTERDAAHSQAEVSRRAQGEAAAAQGKAEASLTSAQANVEAAKAELQAERHTRFEETKTLTQIAENLHKKIEADAEAARAQLQAERQEKLKHYKISNQIAEDLQKKLREISEQKERLLRHNQELLCSTSWRITAPMRAIKAKLSLHSRRQTK